LLAPNADGGSAQLDVRMHHGKKREIRLLFSTLGFDVKRLKRYQIGAFSLKGIPVRAVRPLTPRDIARLFQTPRPPAQKAKDKKQKQGRERSLGLGREQG
ncbi:MAG: hypothetical protein LBM04_13610, partial [Opitutaceae bacterium]|nr:hypothetical protein [Opitutaceae bacterium]